MSTTPCFMCAQPVGAARPGDVYDAIAAHGMRLEGIPVCNGCAAKAHPASVCVHCHAGIGAERPGDRYDAVSARGRSVHGFWVCHPCAVPLGPRQGLTDTLKAELDARHR